MNLQKTLQQKKEQKPILLMTHIVLGYPSFDVNRAVIRQMVDNGVDCIELQIPFSEPMADGPIILRANQDSIASGTTIEDCLAFAAEMTNAFTVPFLYMTYFNIIYKFGENAFLERVSKADIKGLILPDLPPEEGSIFFKAARSQAVAPIMIYSPTSSDQRMRELNQHGEGFVYCTARRGVTGKHSDLDRSFNDYLKRCRKATQLPIAVGFGIQNRDDIEHLIGLADIAVIGSQTIKLVDERGPDAVGPFIQSLSETI
jgi:tryptophan synthase alpha chain